MELCASIHSGGTLSCPLTLVASIHWRCPLNGLLLAAAEHMARLKAEGEAQNASRRLAVAQEQLAEYAAQKEMDAAALLQQAQQLEALVQDALQVGAAV